MHLNIYPFVPGQEVGNRDPQLPILMTISFPAQIPRALQSPLSASKDPQIPSLLTQLQDSPQPFPFPSLL